MSDPEEISEDDISSGSGSDFEPGKKPSKKVNGKAGDNKKETIGKAGYNKKDKSEDKASKPKSPKKARESIERVYQKKTQKEHILLRPDTYIGSVEKVTQVFLVLVPVFLKFLFLMFSFFIYSTLSELDHVGSR